MKYTRWVAFACLIGLGVVPMAQAQSIEESVVRSGFTNLMNAFNAQQHLEVVRETALLQKYLRDKQNRLAAATSLAEVSVINQEPMYQPVINVPGSFGELFSYAKFSLRTYSGTSWAYNPILAENHATLCMGITVSTLKALEGYLKGGVLAKVQLVGEDCVSLVQPNYSQVPFRFAFVKLLPKHQVPDSAYTLATP